MRLLCPHCGCNSHLTRTKQLSSLTRELYHQCNNPSCGHAFVSLQEITRTLIPSDTPNPDIHLPVSQHPQHP